MVCWRNYAARPGWLDGKAAHEISPHGANQPVKKGKVLDAVSGKWQGVNDFVYQRSNQTIGSFSAYSMIDDPMTSCGCFECIACPERTEL